jgi:hypothetical protein
MAEVLLDVADIIAPVTLNRPERHWQRNRARELSRPRN